MKKRILKAVARLAEKEVIKSNNTTCLSLTYQPKQPANIKDFKAQK